jgi:Protein of unknown function (DUF1573)
MRLGSGFVKFVVVWLICGFYFKSLAEISSNVSGLNCIIDLEVCDKKAIEPDKLKKLLAIDGKCCDEPTTARVEYCLNREGYAISMVQTDNIGELLDQIDNKTAIVFSKLSNSDAYYTILRRESSHANAYLWDNYPTIGKHLSEEEVKAVLGKQLSGFILIEPDKKIDGSKVPSPIEAETVNLKRNDGSRNEAPSGIITITKGDSIQIATKLSVGQITRGDDLITADVPFRNFGKDPIEIRDVKGACSCFKNREHYPKKVNPGEATVIHLAFDPITYRNLSKFSTAVIVITSDKTLPLAQVFVTGQFDDSRAVISIPETQDVGSTYSSLDKSASLEGSIAIYTKMTGVHATIKSVNFSHDILEMRVMPFDPDRVGNAEKVAEYHFKINAGNIPEGPHAEHVVFTVDVNGVRQEVSSLVRFNILPKTVNYPISHGGDAGSHHAG